MGQVAKELGRDAILIELNPVYIEMQRGRNAIKTALNERHQEQDKDADQTGWLF